jgi:hypothetical protein
MTAAKDKERKPPTPPMPLTKARAWIIVRRAALAHFTDERQYADRHFDEAAAKKADCIYYAVVLIDDAIKALGWKE